MEQRSILASKVRLSFTHWGRVTHICVGNLTIIDSDNGLSPGRRQAIILTSAGLLSIGPLGTNSMKFQSEFKHFHSRKCSSKCRLRNGVHFVSASMCWLVRITVSHSPQRYFIFASRFTPSQWQTVLLCNDVCHWLGAILESALNLIVPGNKIFRWDLHVLHINIYLIRYI